MYRYDTIDQDFVTDRSREFREQCRRRLAGELTEDQFKPLRLMNGLYLQLHAYMLRVAIPYGALSTEQLRRLAHIARTYDKGYGHFTTRTEPAAPLDQAARHARHPRRDGARWGCTPSRPRATASATSPPTPTPAPPPRRWTIRACGPK